jgi:lipid A 3-O-deacylase
MKKTTMTQLGAAALLLAAALPANAVDFRPDGIALQAGVGEHGSHMAGVGLVWNWDFERLRRKAELTAHTELMVNRWRADAIGGGHLDLTQYVLLPTLRIRPSRGTSPFFFEFGIGASWMSRQFATPDKTFGTRWNFYDVLGLGYSIGGAQSKHEVGLRWNHTSNGGVRDPNPGHDFIQLRYVMKF